MILNTSQINTEKVPGPRKRHSSFKRLVTPLAFLLSALVSIPAVSADSVDMAAAKKEGKVVWYTSTPIKQAQQIANLFEAKTGIKVELFRSGGSAILRRFNQEVDAGRIAADVLTHSDPAAADLMAGRGLFLPFKPEGFDQVAGAGKNEKGLWFAQRLNVMTMYLRADKIKAADYPKTWSDLSNAKYKGQMVITDPSFTSLQVTVVGTLSKQKGWEFYEGLRKNEIMVVKGNQQVSDMIKKGERYIAVGALDSYAAEDRKAGHDIKTLYPSDGVFVIPSPTSVVKGSPNPNAAKVFAAFNLSREAQEIFPNSGGYAARMDIKAPDGSPAYKTLKVIDVDYDALSKESSAIKKKFNSIFQ
ncbi:MAG: extracellular solute-binding protein [Burkholderiaceae bacterium]